ncbi:aspartate aminotransferase family protein [Haloechinothrix sp. YIM 98757]|uniref:Aspartate aminotransferase family protein n=1 Tax=Haloechinothrix aidingensis TaxID=2752311 RepID=A0A837ZXF6_9PSEU|nr:aminotransferase class III-fold pyridoxal phosphate-dependent enzyme [Haloechinothrix aidingensis]MBA0125316.1 aspartate aminotransferase family protein [Haloechinothrix aidingensis]
MNAAPTTPTTGGQADLLSVDADYLWHPWSPSRVNAETTVAVSGQGCEVRDADGHRYLDARSSGLNANLGYGCRPVIDAVSEQLSRLMTYDLGEGANVPAIRLAQRIAELTGPRLTRTFFCNSGSEAVEATIRVARFYHAALGSPERNIIVSLDNAYHGATMAAAACSAASSPFADAVAPPGFVTVPRPVPEAGPSGSDGVEALRDFLAENGERTAAVIVEPVQARGAYISPDNYLRAARELCDRHGVLLVLDEVTTGFGRTGRMFGYEHAGIPPDVLLTSKGLGAGYVSLAAVTTTEHVFDVFDRNKREMAGFVHGHTHSGHAAACAAGLAVIDFIDTEGILANVRARGDQLLDALAEVHSLPFVHDVRGRGLLVAVETDSRRRASRMRRHMRAAGVLVRRVGPNVLLAPPLVVTSSEIDRIATSLVAAAGVVGTGPG